MCDTSMTVHRITCGVKRDRERNITKLLSELGVKSVLIESGRSVRRRRQTRLFGLPGYTERLDNSPIDLYQFSVSPAVSKMIIERLADALHLNRPGHGTIYVQECAAFTRNAVEDTVVSQTERERAIVSHNNEEHTIAPAVETKKRLPGLLENLSVITCIMSMNGGGEEIAKLALELGTGVPFVTRGLGAGLRDRLGLLRVTVPSEKEVVRMLVPDFDTEGLMQMLIEKGSLNRPGKGFIYCKPVQGGLLDTALLVGPQQHAATMAQVVAAIDELEKNTAWRRRFHELGADTRVQLRLRHDEITITCKEEAADEYVAAAMKAGATSATNSHLQRVTLDKNSGAARERYTFVIRHNITEQVLDALMEKGKKAEEELDSLETQPVKFSFAYRMGS